jgi:hypothetical protein
MPLQNSDLFYVQRGADGYKMPASALNDFIAGNAGLLNYKGAVDCTLAVGSQLETNPPVVGDVYINTGTGTVDSSGSDSTDSWVGITGEAISDGQRVVWDGSIWEIVGQAAGGGLESVVAGNGIDVDNSDAANPVVSATKATQSAYGTTKLAQDPPDSGDLTSTEVTDVLHVAHFNELAGRITTSAAGGLQAVTGTDPIEVSTSPDGTSATISVKSASTTQEGVLKTINTIYPLSFAEAVTGMAVTEYAVPLDLTGLPPLS